MILITSCASAVGIFTVLAWRFAFTTSALSRSVEGIVAVIDTKLSLSDSPGITIISVAVNTLLLVIRFAVIVTSNTGVITLLASLCRVTIGSETGSACRLAFTSVFHQVRSVEFLPTFSTEASTDSICITLFARELALKFGHH